MAEARERTFIMVKPDGVQRGLVGKIIKRFEQKGFKLVGLKFVWVSRRKWSAGFLTSKKSRYAHVTQELIKNCLEFVLLLTTELTSGRSLRKLVLQLFQGY